MIQERKRMSTIVFWPHVGHLFGKMSCFGMEVAVMGESHYGKPGEPLRPTVTQDAVQCYGIEVRHPFFTKVGKLMVGGRLASMHRGEGWAHFAFFNYIQTWVGTTPRVRPTTDMWSQARAPFFEVLALLQPKVLVVLGRDLGRHLPSSLPAGLEVCVVTHPSAPTFTYQDAFPSVQRAIARASAANR